MDLLPPDIDRILPELEIGFARFPVLANVGIKRWVNGAFTFTPDGNPLFGPVPGKKNYGVACGCMGGFSQGGAIGLTLAQWMIHGDPGADIFGMDVARYGAFAAQENYLKDMTRQFYARRFVISYRNEELPAGRPLKTSPVHDLLAAVGALFGCTWGMETPQFFAQGRPGFVETPMLAQEFAILSEAFDQIRVERMVRAGLARVDAEAMLFVSDYFAFQAAGRGGE